MIGNDSQKKPSLEQIRLKRRQRERHHRILNRLFFSMGAAVFLMIPILIFSSMNQSVYAERVSAVNGQLEESLNSYPPQPSVSPLRETLALLQAKRESLEAENALNQEELTSMDDQICNLQAQLATKPVPTEPAPTEPTPTEPAPTEPAPTEPAPTEPTPTEPTPTEPPSPDTPQGKTTVYLTFDDGPSYLTGQVLDILDRYGIKATFFVTYTDKPELTPFYQQIVSRGHSIGIHTASHDYDYIYGSFEQFKADFIKIYSHVGDLTGVYSSLYRFPGGSSNLYGRASFMADQIRGFLSEMGCVYMDWNVTNGDGAWVSADTAYQTVINEIQGRKTPVILMHDGEKKESTVESLPRIIETLLSQGYAFDRLTPSSPLVQQGISWDP